MFDARRAPWEGLGNTVVGAKTSAEVLDLAGLNWQVVTKPALTTGMNDEIITIPGKFWTMRNDNSAPLGMISGQYKIVQNSDAFAFTDELVGEGALYETAGVLQGGRRIWLLAKLPEVSLVDDKVCPFLVFSNGHDGQGAVKVAITPIRVVCQNTLNLALKDAPRMWSVNHTGKIEYKMEEARRTLKLANIYMNHLSETSNKMSNKSIGHNEAIDFIEALIPMPKDAGVQKEDNIISLRNELWTRYSEAPDIDKFRGTQWGMINAVSDFVTHRRPFKMTDTYQENLFRDVVDGHEEMDRAMRLLKVA
jgi:phage/plasmid-like protein (TIGR03299 family)